MNHLITTCAVVALLAMAGGAANAQNDSVTTEAPKAPPAAMTICPMMSDSAMHKDMVSMMSEMQAMVKDSKDPAMKERMEKMHARMTAMMAGMQSMVHHPGQ